MKVNLFSPLPPARTDIAQCVARMLPALSAALDLTLWTDSDDVDARTRRMAKVRRYDADNMDWRALSYADLNIYSIGNDARFHAPIMEIARRVPGLVILHDVCVHELAYYTIERRPAGRERYLALLEREGAEAVELGKTWLEGRANLRDLAQKYPLTWWPLEGALGVVSHNASALLEAVPNLRIPLLDTPLPWLPNAELPAPRGRTLSSGAPLELLVCGHLNSPSRRLSQILDAIAAYPRPERLLLHVAGSVRDEKALRRKIHTLCLGRNVRLHGYLSEEALGRLMDRVHMALNLRWPSVGEASGAQLRFWNHSLPSIATRTGWYERQPEGSLLLLDPERELKELHRHWDAALNNYDELVEYGLRGRMLLEERHCAEAFAAALLDFAPIVKRYQGSMCAPSLARRTGQALGGLRLGDEALSTALAKRLAGQIAAISGTSREDA